MKTKIISNERTITKIEIAKTGKSGYTIIAHGSQGGAIYAQILATIQDEHDGVWDMQFYPNSFFTMSVVDKKKGLIEVPLLTPPWRG